MVGGRRGSGVTLAVLVALWGCSGEAPGGRGAPAASAPEADALSHPPSVPDTEARPPQPTEPPDTLPPEVALHPLEGTEWVLVALPGAPPPPPGARATLMLDREGGLARGSTGCNTFDGSWEVAGTRLSLGLTSITERACGGALARLETDYLEALRRTGSFRLRGDTLELMGEAGVVARLEPGRTTGG